MSPSCGIGPNPSTKDAELIAFRVGEYHPRRVTLPDIGPPSTERMETFDFCGLIDRTEVKMESVLARLLLRNRHEQQARHPIRVGLHLELVRGVAHDNPAQRPPTIDQAPPDREVDDDLLPNEIHIAHSATSVSQADFRGCHSMHQPEEAAPNFLRSNHDQGLLRRRIGCEWRRREDPRAAVGSAPASARSGFPLRCS